MSNKPTLWVRLQVLDPFNEPASSIAAVVDVFYRKVIDDPELCQFFQGMDMTTQKKHLSDFVGTAFGNPHPTYTGRSVAEAHARPRAQGMVERHFMLVAEHLMEAMRAMHLPEDYIQDAAALVLTLMRPVVHGTD